MLRFLTCIVSAALVIAGAALAQVAVAPPAGALDNGLALTPPMGWNDWNAFGCNVSAALVEQTAQAIVSEGLKDAGYQYVNIDDCWALPQRDANGNLVADPAKFPDGIAAVADYVHSLGLKLGIYEDSGTKTCSSSHGFPGSLGHEDADALQFAQWGVDYLKYDDCNQPADQQNIPATVARYTAMRDALAKAGQETGHQIVFSICEKTDFGVPNSAWPPIGNLWRTTGDIHDQYSRMVSIFHSNVQLADLAGPGAWNDPDMLEIGNGGQTDAEYRSEFSLWSEMAAPLIAGTDLRNASPATLAIYGNREVIAVDQDPLGKQGTVVSSDNGHWVLTKPLANGDVATTLFNETDTPATISATAAQLGLGRANAYTLRDLWAHTDSETAGAITAVVPPHSTVMYRVSAGADPDTVAPHTAFGMSGLDAAQPGQPVTVTETFTDDGRIPAENVQLALDAPSDWTVRPTSSNRFPVVLSGQTVTATWQVTEPQPGQPFPSWTINGSAAYVWGPDGTTATATASQTLTAASPVQPPYRTVSSTTATFGQGGDALGIRAAGATGYGAIYLPNAEQDGTVATVQVTSNTGGQAGIMVRNDIAQTGNSPGFVTASATPGQGYVLQWDASGDGQLDGTTAAGTIAYPSWLRLTRNGATFTAAYSVDGTTWTPIGSATVPSAAATQDVGVFATANSSTIGEADFAHFSAGPPSAAIDAARSIVTLPGQASPVNASVYDHGSAAVSNVSVTLSAPAGWTVSPATPVNLGTVAAGASAPVTWQVTAPADAPAGATALTVDTSYQDGGQTVHSQATISAVVPSADLSSAFDNVGITDDTNTNAGNIDGAGSSLSAQALAAVGVTPGALVSHGGFSFAWPNVPAGQPDNVVANGQSFQLSGTGTKVGLLATATYGPATGIGTIAYSDGTTQQFDVTVPDWYSNPPSGSDIAITMSYRNRSGNTQQQHAIHVFLVTVPLLAGKTPTGVTLPDVGPAPPVSGTASLHVFGISLG